MRRTAAAVILIISLIIFVSACAGPLGDASKALNDWDYKTAYRLVKLWAGQRSPEAQFNLGFMYYKGEGVSQNYPEATKWLRKAAEQGHVKAQFLLSSIVAKWLRKAADQGDGYSQANLGHMYYGGLYYGGLGVPQDYSEAAKWYRKAADQGIASAQTNLGAMYDKGEGVPQDYAEAAKWYRKAAEQGNAKAQNNLGHMYYAGESVPQDYAEAAKWYRKAAEQGNAKAQGSLGFIYFMGRGVPKDYVISHMWFNLAGARLSASESKKREIVKHYMDIVDSKMTPAQIAEAQRLAREWKPKKEN